MKNPIGWCSETWNPIRGCLNKGECKEYCYARRMNKRTWESIMEKEINYYFPFWEKDIKIFKRAMIDKLKNFIPTWIESNFIKKFPKKPHRIFIGSMSEIYYWKKSWMERVLDKIREYPQHTFQFLTKFPETYIRYFFPKNCWLGLTVTKNSEMEKLESFDYLFTPNYDKRNLTYFSIEPILENIDLSVIKKHQVNWIIIGALSGTKKRQPEPWWIGDIYGYCYGNKISLFMKDSIKPYWSFDLIQEFPRGENE